MEQYFIKLRTQLQVVRFKLNLVSDLCEAVSRERDRYESEVIDLNKKLESVLEDYNEVISQNNVLNEHNEKLKILLLHLTAPSEFEQNEKASTPYNIIETDEEKNCVTLSKFVNRKFLKSMENVISPVNRAVSEGVKSKLGELEPSNLDLEKQKFMNIRRSELLPSNIISNLSQDLGLEGTIKEKFSVKSEEDIKNELTYKVSKSELGKSNLTSEVKLSPFLTTQHYTGFYGNESFSDINTGTCIGRMDSEVFKNSNIFGSNTHMNWQPRAKSPEYDLVTTEANTKEEESLWFPKPKSTEHLNSTSVRHETEYQNLMAIDNFGKVICNIHSRHEKENTTFVEDTPIGYWKPFLTPTQTNATKTTTPKSQN